VVPVRRGDTSNVALHGRHWLRWKRIALGLAVADPQRPRQPLDKLNRLRGAWSQEALDPGASDPVGAGDEAAAGRFNQ